MTTHDPGWKQPCQDSENNLKHRELHKVFSPPFPEGRGKHYFWARPPSPHKPLLVKQPVQCVSGCTTCSHFSRMLQQEDEKTRQGGEQHSTLERRWIMHLWLWHKNSNLQTHELFMQVVYASATELEVSSGPSRIYELKCSTCIAVLLLQGMMIQKSLCQSILD